MTFEISVPGTLSNLGPGFDVLGMAVSVENHFRFDRAPAGQYLADGRRTAPDKNAVFRTVQRAEEVFGARLTEGLSCDQREEVPRARGLGSSATARVAGFIAWAHYTGARPDLTAALSFLAQEEGHPDNATAAMLGGLTICAASDGQIAHLRIEPPDYLRIAIAIPERRVVTDEARGVLPREYPRADAVHNLSRLAFLLTGLLTDQPKALKLGVEDRIHQPYRAPLIGPVDEALSGAYAAGASGAFISGSGSTLAALVDSRSADAQRVADALAAPFVAAGIPARALAAAPALQGAWTRFTSKPT